MARSVEVVEIPASRLAEAGRPDAAFDAIGQLFARDLLAVLVRDVLSPVEIAALRGGIERGAPALPEIHVPHFRGPIFGRPLVTTSGELGPYLDDAARFQAGCGPLHARLAEVLGGLA